MVLFARNRRYYLIPVEHKKENYGEIFDKRKNLIGRIRMRGKDIIVTEANGVVCLRLRKLGSSVKYRIEDHFGNYLGRVGVFKSHKEEIEVEDRYNKRVLFTKGFVEWTFTIQDKRKKKIAIGGTTNIMFSKDRFGIRHVRPSFLLSVKPHHPDSRFLLAVFIILLKKCRELIYLNITYTWVPLCRYEIVKLNFCNYHTNYEKKLTKRYMIKNLYQ